VHHTKTFDLEILAKNLMREGGFEPEFSKAALKQLDAIHTAALSSAAEDLRSLLWCSIDNDDSRDLDQLTYGERKDDRFTIWVAIADVDALVPKNSPIDKHAEINTTSVYTPAKIFTMLPEKLSTDLTSLNENADRLSIVVKLIISSEGECEEASIFQALVRNYAKLTYNSVGAWLAGSGEIPEKVRQVQGLQDALICQHQAAQTLKKRRHEMGALTLETIEPEAKVMADLQVILWISPHNYAEQLIENFMIAANSAIARQFRSALVPSLRRIVRIPKRWDRIVQVAALHGFSLPEEPDAKALDAFLIEQKRTSPETFPDLSLTIIKLLGRGEYVVEVPGSAPIGHFGLALREYMHFTAPNRRFPDLISQRICKAYLHEKATPYTLADLKALSAHCTQQEDTAMKIERHLTKSAAAQLLSSRVGAAFNGIITGAGVKGTWVRIFDPPVEGKIIRGFSGLDVGDKVTVKLAKVDVPQGHIDFILSTAAP
jgi:VacB/RNase II family 3'-5' exoribonuclease